MKKLAFFISILSVVGLLHLPAYSQGGSYIMKPAGSNFLLYGYGRSRFIVTRSKLTQMKLGGLYKKLASAKRITSAADDPSGLAVSERMKSIVASLKQEVMNASDYRNYLRYYGGMVAQNQRLLKRIRLVIIRSSSGILGPSDREINQREISQLLRQIDMNARFAQFNKKRVMPGINTQFLGVRGLSVVRNPYGALKQVDAALAKLIRIRSVAGIRSNTLALRIKGKTFYYVNLMASQSRITDLDMAEGIRRLMKNSVILKSQHGTLMQSLRNK